MKNDILKESIQKRVKEEIAIANLKEEIEMEQIRNKKIFYGILSSCALLALCAGIIINKLPANKQNSSILQAKLSNHLMQAENMQENKQDTTIIELNIKEIDTLLGIDYAIDGKRTKIDGKVVSADLKYTINVRLPQDIIETSCYGLYIKNKNSKEYEVLHSYEFCYSNQEQTRTITLGLGVNGNKPPRDYYMLEVEEKSRIGNVELEITKYKDLYLVLFTHKGIQFDVETKGISQEELVQFLKSVICENTTYPGMKIEDKEINAAEIPKENNNNTYPDFYAGKYIDGNGKNVVLLCEDTEENKNQICKLLEISKDKTIFKIANYSFNYLNKLQERITQEMQDKKLQSISSSVVIEQENRIKVTVTSKSEIEKIKALDSMGNAIDIVIDTGEVASHELLKSK